MSKDFDWKRFWGPRDGQIDLSDHGFLSDPEGEYGKYLNPKLVSFDRLDDKRCAVLLGEPGIGKSWALDKESSRVQEAGAKVLRLNLRSYSDESRLMEALFESDEFESWRKGDWLLHLYLDSLDECLLRIDNVAAILADELPEQPVDRLRLRIACRTAPWPTLLENALESLFGDCPAYELAPLRRIDVLRAAEQSGISNPKEFLQRIDEHEVSSLAIKPVTLKFLISTFLKEGDFPKDHLELYENGCRILCEESNKSRLSANRRGRLNLDERLAVASRIAAVTQLCNKFAVYKGTEAEGVPPEDVSISDLVGGVEHASGEVPVSVEAVREVLDTGLFSSRGADRMGWAHQTYAEFLTAHYCHRRKMSIEQVSSLIFHRAEQSQKLIPQLHEVAAWMSVTNPRILKAVANSDPEALLGAAAANLTDDERKLIAGTILQQASAGRPLHLQWRLRWLYRKLKHAGLSKQLRPYLRDARHSGSVRHVAIDIAAACNVEELGPDLAKIALDQCADTGVRNSAAATVAAIGSAEVRARLRPLALGQAGDDPDDELKGSGLQAIWPESLSAPELFGLLTPPRNSSLSGAYARFLYDHVIEKLSGPDLPVALEWLAKQEHRHQILGPIDRLMDGIIFAAWEHVEEPPIASGLAAAIVSRLKLYDSIVSATGDIRTFVSKVAANEVRRRALLTSLIPLLGVDGISRLYISNLPLLTPLDLEWHIERALNAETPESLTLAAKLVRFAFNSNDREAAEKLWRACESNPVLKTECGGYFVTELDSAAAKFLKEELNRKTESNTPKLLTPTPAERIAWDLQKVDAGEVAWWQQLTLDLTLEPTSQMWGSFGQSLLDTPGWKACDDDTKRRILDSAVRYLKEADPQNDAWFRTRTIPGDAISGFRAWALLTVTDDARLNGLSEEVWKKWVPTFLRAPSGVQSEQQLQVRLLEKAHQLVPSETATRILGMVDAENEQNGFLVIAKEMEICWDQGLSAALAEKANSPTLKPQILSAILEFLLQREHPGSRELVESLIESRVYGSEEQKSQAVAAAGALIRCTQDAGWATIWPLLKRQKSLGRQIIESLSHGHAGGTNFVSKLDEHELAEFYVWMVKNYPYAKSKGGVRFMGPADSAAMLRDGILGHLKSRGTFAACDALRRVMRKLPQLSWLRLQLEEAESLARASTWSPVSPRDFLALALDGEKRFVENGVQLVQVILESLDRLQLKLHEELPAAEDLWNTEKRRFTPKDEQQVADYIARHLREDLRHRGVIVNREVQIRRRPDRGRKGERTDIHVDAIAPPGPNGDSDKLHAIVEVKGNWNAELRDAMETQLRDRYLRKNRCKNGLYLPIWFASMEWSDKDSRKRLRSRMALAEARKYFARQAATLSTDGYWIRSYVLDASLVGAEKSVKKGPSKKSVKQATAKRRHRR